MSSPPAIATIFSDAAQSVTSSVAQHKKFYDDGRRLNSSNSLMSLAALVAVAFGAGVYVGFQWRKSRDLSERLAFQRASGGLSTAPNNSIKY